MAKPRKPKMLKKPRKPKSRTEASMKKFIQRVEEVERKNKAREAAFKRDLASFESTKRKFESV